MATLIIDASPTTGSNFTANPQGQTFSGTDIPGPLTTVDTWMSSTDASFVLTLKLQGVSAGQPDGITLATATTISTGTLPSTAGTVTFTFPTPFTLVSGTNYSLVISCSSNTTGTLFYWDNAGTYANGEYGQGTWTMFPAIDATLTLRTTAPPANSYNNFTKSLRPRIFGPGLAR